MPSYTFDTSVVISRKVSDIPDSTGASQRMALDALIAVSARRLNATVITDNWDDFKAIQRYCNVKLIRGSKFFR